MVTETKDSNQAGDTVSALYTAMNGSDITLDDTVQKILKRVSKENSWRLQDRVVQMNDEGDYEWVTFRDYQFSEGDTHFMALTGKACVAFDTLLMERWTKGDAAEGLDTPQKAQALLDQLPKWDQTKYFIRVEEDWKSHSGVLFCEDGTRAPTEVQNDVLLRYRFTSNIVTKSTLQRYDKEHSRDYPTKSPYHDGGFDSWDEYQKFLAENHERTLELFGYEAWYYKVTCQVCLETFYAKHPARYCSQRCANDDYLARRRERKEAKRKKLCPVCNRSFNSRRSDTVFCSAKCKQSDYRNKRVTAPSCP